MSAPTSSTSHAGCRRRHHVVVIEDVVVGSAGTKGLGVFARRNFSEGEFIFRRRHGRVVTTSEFALLSEEERRHLCELDFDRSAVLFPPGCYLNHSCQPNAMRSGVRVFAWRAIAADEEITVDYRLNAFDDHERWDCECGSPPCTGIVVGSFFSLPDETQKAYLPYAPPFIRREHRHRSSRA
jgi:SET domain-containing protein